MPKPKIMFYQDGRHPLIYVYEPPMQKEEYEAAVDEISGTTIDTLMFCLGEGRVMLHDTKVGELWGHNVDKWPHHIWKRTHQNVKALIEQGHDPLRLICDRAHEKGLLFYPSLIMQVIGDDKGGERTTWVRCSDFRFENRHLEIGARGSLDPGFPGYEGLDFKHEEVREERFAIVQEVLNNYPVDGFELNLVDLPYYFHPDEVEANRHILTEWVGRVSEEVKRSGPDRDLAIRIPARIDDCLAGGMDPMEWIRQGFVDSLIGDGAAGFHLANPMADFRPLVEAARESECRVHAVIHNHVDSDRVLASTIEMVRATASNYWAQGVDGLYLGRGWFYDWPYEAPFYEKLRELAQPDIMAPRDKYYRIPSYKGERPKPETGPGSRMQLPAVLELNEPATIEIDITDDLPRWDKMGRVYEVLLRVRIEGTTELDRFGFKLNGQELPDRVLRKINHMIYLTNPRYTVGGYWFVFTLDGGLWPRNGENTLEVTLLEQDPDIVSSVYVADVELETKYLMGRNFRRGFVDPALGRYDGRMGGW